MIYTKKISFLKLSIFTLMTGSMLWLNSCIKDENTHPVRLSVSVNIAEQYKTSDTLSFEKGEIIIKEIQFEGKREAGEDYSFNSETGKKYGPKDFFPQSGSRESIALFDIPQGIYTLMKWRFELSDGLEKFEPDDDDNNETPGLIIQGNYIRHNGKKLLVRIEIDPFESFECQTISQTGEKKINAISGKVYNAVLFFDPYFAFRSISSDSIDDADYSDDEKSPLLLISSDSNEELYEIILFRLQQSVKIIFS
jgi:hypothetical protein